MLFAGGAVHTSKLLGKRGGTRVGATAIEDQVLLSTLRVCCCGLDVQHLFWFILPSEQCAMKMSNAQRTSGRTTVLTRGRIFQLLEESQGLQEAAH